MKKLYSILILTVCCFHFGCKNPLNGIKLYVKNDYYKYTVTLSIKDAKNALSDLTNATVSVSGADGTSIYDKDGTTKFKVDANGILDLSVIPTLAPTTNQPITFTINISAPNYIPVSKVVTITPKQTEQRFNIRLINKTNPPNGIGIGLRTINMSSGGTSRPGYTGARITSMDSTIDLLNEDVVVYVPTGLGFYYYQSKDGLITGTRPTMLTHDSTVMYGANQVIYRPTTEYYTEEAALIPSDYSPVAFAGTSMDITLVYQTDLAPDYSIYTYGSNVNTINTLKDGTQNEDNILFTTAAKKRIIAVYFIGHQKDGTDICISPNHGSSDSSWYISYRIDPTKTNPITGNNYQAGDEVETGIAYTPTSYPIVPAGVKFSPLNLNTTKNTIRLTATGDIRVECQSTDVGIYQLGGNPQTFDFNFNTFNDTNNIPDPENLYANATIAITSGTNTSYYNFTLTPDNDFEFKGSLVGPFTSLPPGFNGSTYTVYYWDSAVLSPQPITNNTTMTIFKQPLAGPTLKSPDQTIRFYYTFLCTATGTPRIVEPTFNGTLQANVGGVIHRLNCNVIGGYWKTKGFKVGDISDPINGSACGYKFAFPSITIANFNYGQVANDNICNCYFHF